MLIRRGRIPTNYEIKNTKKKKHQELINRGRIKFEWKNSPKHKVNNQKGNFC